MPAVARTLRLTQLKEADAAWRLLDADSAPVVAGLLGHHLGGDERRVDAEEFYERLDADLERLRDQGLTLPLSAKGYCAQWRAAGFLTRRASVESRGETLELSPDAIVAIRFIEGRAAPRSSATESRLASLAAQVRRLAIDTDPDTATRIALLEEEIERIERRIRALQAGDEAPLDESRVLERVRDLLAQAADVPDDFARVRADFEALNTALRQKIVESDAAQATVVDEVFRGVDHIAESEAGRSFGALSQLVLDPALGAAFEADVRRVLDRGFARRLSPAERRLLRSFLTTLKARSAEIHDVITVFARALRRYVQSHDYQQDRVLRSLLRDAQHAGVQASPHIRPWHPIGLSLDLSAVELSTVGALELDDPAEFAATDEVTAAVVTVADLDELRALARETEIDFDELTRNVNDVLSQLPSCTVAEVLAHHPATQGVASVIGLLTLAAAQGTVDDELESVAWTSTAGVPRAAVIPAHRFTGEVT
ncbi:DUF3375 domain-containing protein [Pseudoclavibacter chungangensis]|uniref:DUF3375 domain-containing protein n=1 Tax=Pseudoclavibacter chungangensis TaxID=587635 RepID=A0A7J5C1L2_9MICO|nr:DUF3375 domain-containing protein [Pseudoclavibacter chungangensis]KAB1659681.1 DUF3375 domain-containing protein [Pseudoclavibacter chungangensis]NYJ67520.1 hypothetical protein [Pseudoclavibacter chungangensis]